MFLGFSNCKTGSSVHDVGYHHGDGSTVISVISRKLKETSYEPKTKETKDKPTMDLEDYHPIDPVPSSKASIKPGPIEHGTPIIPYIPKPSPPNHPKRGGSG
ncbi:uncharacterized protein LOC133804706 [Humulus lupulus]|uniref:uncharacterized protein LOC133804706 n=1 Tax=Humulus lupulus TaxID=3486 RepID=UPI002B417292|nr:uncharacterized protein LOC133804706 [Humulus lupulus]